MEGRTNPKQYAPSTFSKLGAYKYQPYVHQIRGAQFQCVNNLYAKFKHKGMKTVEFKIHTNQIPLSISDGKCLDSTPLKNEKYKVSVHEKGRAHLIF